MNNDVNAIDLLFLMVGENLVAGPFISVTDADNKRRTLEAEDSFAHRPYMHRRMVVATLPIIKLCNA